MSAKEPKARTPLGEKLRERRREIVDSGQPLLTEQEVLAELEEARAALDEDEEPIPYEKARKDLGLD